MPLSFLVPAFLLGLAALAIPVIVHLTRKRRAETRAFPSLMFLEKVPYQAESRRRIHHWALLALRALALALIVAAFARPFLTDPEAVAGATSGPREVVVLVDRSYSMAVADHWERAREAARERIAGLGPLDRASVVFFARGAEVAVRSSADRARLRSALDTASLSDEATRYGPGLKLAQTILEESDLPARELVLVSDFQRAGWTGDDGVTLPPGTVVTPVPLTDAAPPNRAVVQVQLVRDRFQGRERVTPTARITRRGGDAPEEVEVTLELDDREIQTRAVTLPADGAETVAFQPFTLADRHTRGTVRLASDALPGDDAHHFVLSPGRALPVVVLDDARSGSGASSLYLRRALEISQEGSFEVLGRVGGALSADLLADAGVVVVNDRPVAAAEARALREFVEGGGGLIVVLGDRAAWPEGALDILPGEPGPAEDRTEGRGGRLGHLEYGHPVFEIFRGPRSGDFTGARFFRARGFRAADRPEVEILARYDDGSPALVEGSLGDGRVLVWTSTLDAFWNDLALQPVFLPFTHQLVRHASGRSEALPAFTAGQVIDVTDDRAMATAGLGETAAVLASGAERVALTPSGESVDLPGGAGPHFLTLAERGFYRIRPPGAGEEVRPVAVAVNVDPAEAELAPLDVEEVQAALAPTDGEPGVGATGTRAERLRLADQERRQSLWRFLLLGAFGLLALETVLANRVSGARRAGTG